MTKAIVIAWHKYTPFGDRYYQPLFDYFIHNLNLWKGEFDKLYILDSTWNFTPEDIKSIPSGVWCEVLKVNPSLRYYDAYKEVLPQIVEDIVLFLDNDMIIYKKEIINEIFFLCEDHISNPVVSIYDSIGTFKPKEKDNMHGKNKFCPYLFATRKKLLMKYRDCDWGPNMPHYETLGKLTELMLKDRVSNIEMPEDKSSIYLDGSYAYSERERGKDLGYYHIRAGSTPAVLLAWLHAGDIKTYYDYIKNQPKNEYLRQIAWYWYMCYVTKNESIMRDLTKILQDVGVQEPDWYKYFNEFVRFHNLPFPIVTYAKNKVVN